MILFAPPKQLARACQMGDAFVANSSFLRASSACIRCRFHFSRSAARVSLGSYLWNRDRIWRVLIEERRRVGRVGSGGSSLASQGSLRLRRGEAVGHGGV